MSILPSKTPEESAITLAQVIFPHDANELGLATAGTILKTIDIAASLTAGKHTRHKVVTASLDRMDFLHPAKLWELVTTHCRPTNAWHSSLEVEVTVEAENVAQGEKRRIASGYLVFVALDDETLKPTAIYPLRDSALAEAAELRKQSRLSEAAQNQILIDEADNAETVKRTMTPDDANIHQKVFGGAILEMIHQAAEKAAERQANGPVIAVRLDRMSFEKPAYIGEEVKAQAVLTRTWHSAMEIQVEVIAKDHKTGEERRVAFSYLVFIAQDSTGHPKTVLPFTPTTPLQEKRWEEAAARQATRLSKRPKIDG